MLYKKSAGCYLAFFLFSAAGVFSMQESEAAVSENENSQDEETVGLNDPDGFLNLRAAHERSNEYPFGPRNSSAIGLNPLVSIGDFTFDAGLYYGRQFSSTFVLKSERFLSKTAPKAKLRAFHESFRDIKKIYEKAMDKNVNKPYLYREYTRLAYVNNQRNFRVVLGDTTTRNQIGTQQALAGAGISVFRRSGNGSEIEAGSPIVITRPTKVECRLGDDILVTRFLAPGVYCLERDLPEEAKIPGITVKLSDQLNRKEELVVEYFGGFGSLKAGEDDFDLSVIYSSRYDVDDPYRVRYASTPHFSGNYRRGLSDKVTVGGGFQAYNSSYTADFTTIYREQYGKIAPYVSFSHDKSHKDAFAGGIYYMTPANKYGIVLETVCGVKEKGFSDLESSKEQGDMYNELMKKYFSSENLREKFAHESETESCRQIIARVYSKPIFGIVPSFTFNGEWSKSDRLREYTISFSTKIFKNVTLTTSAGLTYDDPTKGVNQQAPDRRLTIAFAIPIDDFQVRGTYAHHEEDRLRSLAELQYNPSEIKGLEITAQDYFKPGYRNPTVSVKYSGNYGDVKLEESIKNIYPNSSIGNRIHNNQQRVFFGTSISKNGLGSYRKSSVNVLRTAREANKETKR